MDTLNNSQGLYQETKEIELDVTDKEVWVTDRLKDWVTWHRTYRPRYLYDKNTAEEYKN